MNKLLYKEVYFKFDPDIPQVKRLNVSELEFNFSGIVTDDKKIFARNSLYIKKK